MTSVEGFSATLAIDIGSLCIKPPFPHRPRTAKCIAFSPLPAAQLRRLRFVDKSRSAIQMTTKSSNMPTPSLTIIVAASSARLGIGLKGNLPWRLKRELAYFKRATTFHPDNLTNVVIMGRKCWESIPPKFRPLPSRHNIVLSRKGEVDGITETSKEVEVATSLEAALARVKENGFGRVFVIGGGEVYREAMNMESCDRILFTEVKADVETDVDFPVDFREDQKWKRKSHETLEDFVGGDVLKGDIVEGDLSYEFQLWVKSSNVQ